MTDSEPTDPSIGHPELRQALAKRYGSGNVRIEQDRSIWVRRRAGGRWKRVGFVAGDTARLPGRPAELTKGRKVTIYLDAETYKRVKLLGNGNLSLGVRRAIEMALL